MEMQSNRDIVVAALKHAAPYVRMYRGKTFVLKVGGEIFATTEGTRALVEQIAILHQVGIRIVLVHGGGPQSTQLAEALEMHFDRALVPQSLELPTARVTPM